MPRQTENKQSETPTYESRREHNGKRERTDRTDYKSEKYEKS
jgi:hypothetical protein